MKSARNSPLRTEGVDIGSISKQLGHVIIATTIRCLDHIAPRAVVEAVTGRMWLGKLPTMTPGDS